MKRQWWRPLWLMSGIIQSVRAVVCYLEHDYGDTALWLVTGLATLCVYEFYQREGK